MEIHDATVEWIYGDGDWLFSISDSSTNDEISVILDKGANTTTSFSLGDDIHLRGTIIQYEDEWEIMVRASSSDYALSDYDYGGGS